MIGEAESTRNNFHFVIPLLAAFIGAILAFIFNILWKWLEANYKREARNWNGLVKLSLMMDDNGALNNLNIHLAEVFLKHLETVWPPIVPFKKLEIDRDVLLEITNIDLMNDIRMLTHEMKRSNAYLTNLELWYSGFKAALLKGTIMPDVEKRCKENITKDLKFWLASIRSLDTDIEIMISKIRTEMKNTSPIIWLVKKLTRARRHSANFAKEYQGEVVKVREERKKIMEANKKKMEELEKASQ